MIIPFEMVSMALISYVAVMSITPGPNNVMLAASGVNFGFMRTIPHMLGISIGHGVQVGVVAIALTYALHWISFVRGPLSVVGCAYLLYLSWQLWNAGQPKQIERAKPFSFLQAALFQWVNPKAWVMVINTAVIFMPKDGSVLWSGLFLALLCSLINLPCIALWAYSGDRLRKWLSTPQYLQIFNGIMASTLAITAFWLLYEELVVWFKRV